MPITWLDVRTQERDFHKKMLRVDLCSITILCSEKSKTQKWSLSIKFDSFLCSD